MFAIPEPLSAWRRAHIFRCAIRPFCKIVFPSTLATPQTGEWPGLQKFSIRPLACLPTPKYRPGGAIAQASIEAVQPRVLTLRHSVSRSKVYGSARTSPVEKNNTSEAIISGKSSFVIAFFMAITRGCERSTRLEKLLWDWIAGCRIVTVDESDFPQIGPTASALSV